jgi:hypothetical protein
MSKGNKAQLVSGRILVNSPLSASDDRYEFLGLADAEPNLGFPISLNSGLTGIYFLPISNNKGIRSWSSAESLSLSGNNISIGTTDYKNKLTVSGNISSISLSTPTITSTNLIDIKNIISNYNGVILADNYNVTNNGNNTLTIDFLSGVYINNNTYIKGNLTVSDLISAKNNISIYGGLTANDNVRFKKDLLVDGNLFVMGSSTQINTTNLYIDDPIIYISKNNNLNLNDIGLVGSFNNGTYQYTGLTRIASDNKWTLFSGLTSDPTSTTNIQTSDQTFKLDTLRANVESSTISSNVLSANQFTANNAIITNNLSVSGNLAVKGVINSLNNITTTGSVNVSGSAGIGGNINVIGSANALSMTVSTNLSGSGSSVSSIRGFKIDCGRY